ncbi:MAG: heavy metal-binding domain-containing protein [Methanobacteriaceae archaeon]
MVSVDEFIISSANDVPGYNIIETKGFVNGLTVRSRGLGGQLGAGIRSMFGGEIKEFVKMMEESRDIALQNAIKHAKEMGANAIIATRYDSNDLAESMQEILVYGTAVVAEKIE